MVKHFILASVVAACLCPTSVQAFGFRNRCCRGVCPNANPTKDAPGSITKAEELPAPEGTLRFEVFRGLAGQWHWRLVAANNNIVASGEGYRNKADLLDTLKLIQRDAASAPVNELGERNDRQRKIWRGR